MIVLVFLHRITSESYSEFLEYLAVNLAEHHCRMYLATVKLRKLLKCLAAVLVMYAEHRNGYKYLVSVKTWVMSMKE